ncbi:GNAT family N-acetyltransferase [Vulcaniibacterium tengchongense]|uniref:RimJ/RimL family protein N-acetyltransferase n=1 Tax=Vulcaniibacterium tengchongense TaxID=1273429 RepID=A0A3N4VXE1_9GAMM|nr:GNAT family N-acetyltransferase [Vulcaniibacterium tengchongense]RPE81787.1 RimJ/RimL family protein N-acetyltransferase [Vulcaniibacterium tengchongense]
MSVPDVQLETPRLILRPPRREDFDAWAAFMADAERTRYIGGAQPRPVAWRGFASMVGAWVLQGYAMFSVIEKASGRWVGRVGPWQPEGWPGPEVGWSLVAQAGGKGYATEAATAAIDWAFDALDWREVIHTIDPANEPSKAVARRLGSGFVRTGRLPPPFDSSEVEVWGQPREAWLARRREARA